MLATAPSELVGSSTPRIGPPRPLHHDLVRYREVAATLGIVPMPWQDTAATYTTAKSAEDRWLYREVAVIVGRQNGKTTFTMPLIIGRLLAGRRIMHIAQVRELPRVMFEAIADAVESTNPDLLPKRRGKTIWARRGAGSESIVLTNGGEYRIASAITGGRGFSFDDLLIDELREMDTFDVVNAAKPAQKFSEDPQTIYLSNMGDEDAVILNSLTARADKDVSLAYLEWSADPDYDPGDIRGWVQSNPAIGHYPQVLRELEQDYRAALLSGNLAGFETEALCRKVPTMRPRLVDDFAWQAAYALRIGRPYRPSFGLGYDPTVGRASIVMAWWEEDGRHIALREVFDVAVDEMGITDLGVDALKAARRFGVRAVGYDDATDRDLARQFSGTFAKRQKKIIGKDFANATEAFVRGVDTGQLRWYDCEHVTADLASTSRKENTETGAYHAVRSKEDVPITAALAAIRAYWLATAAPPSRSLQVM
jgi:hypothetical protein